MVGAPAIDRVVRRPDPKVLLAEDHPMFRDGLAALLRGRAGVTQVQAVASGTEAVAAAASDPPDVAVVDLRMPEGDGLWLTAALIEQHPAIREHRAAKAGLVDLLEEVAILEITEELVAAAADLAEEEALRGYDAVHLACNDSNVVHCGGLASSPCPERKRCSFTHLVGVIDARWNVPVSV
jgi:CheY-like chemotaxis protein